MKSFNLANYDRLNLECVIAGRTYVDEDFVIGSGLSEIKIKGRMEDFNLLRTAKTLVINIVTSTQTHTYDTYYVKHPVTFDGEFVSLDLDKEPANKDVSYTTTDGVALPYSFGRPHVRVPKVSEEVVGVITESQYALSFNNVANIFDAYQAAVPALAQASLFGLDTDRDSELSAVQAFYKVISNMQDLVPSKAAILEEFYAMISWRGATNEYHGKDVFGGFVYFKNAGLPPLISTYTLFQTNTNADVDASTDATYGTHIGNMSYHNVQSGATWDLDSIRSYYRNLANQLMAMPDTLKIELPDGVVGAVTLKIQGLLVSGTYDGAGTLTVTSRAPEAVSWGFSAASGYRKVDVPSAAGRDLTGKFLRVWVPNAWYSSVNYSFTGVVKVMSQVGTVLELDMLPYENYATNTSISPSAQTYSHGSTRFSGLLRSGTITAISDTVEGAKFQGVPVIYAGDYLWDAKNLIEVPAYYIESKDSPTVADVNVVIYYKDYRRVQDDTNFAFIQPSNSYGADPTIGSKAAYAGSFLNGDFNWHVELGEEIELDTDQRDVFVVDFRPNMPVLGVKSRVGQVYADVDPGLYTILPEYTIDGQTVTALQLNFDLTHVRLSNDIVVQVDTGQYTLPAILQPLATLLGVGYSDSGNFVAAPNFTVHGFTPAGDIIRDVVEQSKGGLTYSGQTLTVKNLAVEPVGAPYAFSIDNIETYDLSTSDYLDILNNTLFEWQSLLPNSTAIVVLNNPPETLAHNSTKAVTIFDDKTQAIDFARWHVHRFGRDWMSVTMQVFSTSLHLEEYDAITFTIKGMSVRGEIQSVTYDHESASFTVEALLETTAESLWSIGGDVTAPVIDDYKVPSLNTTVSSTGLTSTTFAGVEHNPRATLFDYTSIDTSLNNGGGLF